MPHSGIPAPDITRDWSILIDYVNTYVNHLASRAELNKRGERVKHTAHFHTLKFLSFFFSFLLTRERFSGSGQGSSRTEAATSQVVLGDCGCDVTCQACRSRSVPSLLW